MLFVVVSAPLIAHAKAPKLDRDRVAQLINQQDYKLYQDHEADPMKLLKYKWINFGDKDSKKTKNVYELWYTTDKGNTMYLYYTFNKKQKPKLIRVGGTVRIDKQIGWEYKQK